MNDRDLSGMGPMDEVWKGNPATRCSAHRKNGDRCKRQARRGTTVCDAHGGKAPQVQAKARQRLEEAADKMARELLGMANGAESEAVKLAAIRDALDRAGLKPKTAVAVEVGQTPVWQEIVSDATVGGSRAESRAARGLHDDTPRWTPPALGPAEPDVVDAELVPDEPEMGPGGHGDELRRGGGGYGPDKPSQPGNGLMTLEEANAEIARANRTAGVYPTRVRYPR